jgi:hypothetical protein
MHINRKRHAGVTVTRLEMGRWRFSAWPWRLRWVWRVVNESTRLGYAGSLATPFGVVTWIQKRRPTDD